MGRGGPGALRLDLLPAFSCSSGLCRLLLPHLPLPATGRYLSPKAPPPSYPYTSSQGNRQQAQMELQSLSCCSGAWDRLQLLPKQSRQGGKARAGEPCLGHGGSRSSGKGLRRRWAPPAGMQVTNRAFWENPSIQVNPTRFCC